MGLFINFQTLWLTYLFLHLAELDLANNHNNVEFWLFHWMAKECFSSVPTDMDTVEFEKNTRPQLYIQNHFCNSIDYCLNPLVSPIKADLHAVTVHFSPFTFSWHFCFGHVNILSPNNNKVQREIFFVTLT